MVFWHLNDQEFFKKIPELNELKDAIFPVFGNRKSHDKTIEDHDFCDIKKNSQKRFFYSILAHFGLSA